MESEDLPWKTLSARSQLKTCAVAICKTPHPPETTLHRFPRDPTLRKAWKKACRRQDKFNVDTAVVCSRHFEAECFERDLRTEMLEKKKSRLLKHGSIPTLWLSPYCGEEGTQDVIAEGQAGTSTRQDRTEKRQRKNIAQHLIATTSSTSENEESPSLSSDRLHSPSPLSPVHEGEGGLLINPASFKTTSVQTETPTQDRQTQCDDQEKATLKRKIRALTIQLQREKQKKPGLKTASKKKIAREILLKSAWSAKQVDAFLEQKERSRWGPEDIVLGLTLRALSRKAYEFLRQKKMLPLPSLTTLQRYARKFDCAPGIQDKILQGTTKYKKAKNLNVCAQLLKNHLCISSQQFFNSSAYPQLHHLSNW